MKKHLKYLIIPAIVLAIVGVWFLKNGKLDDNKEDNGTSTKNKVVSMVDDKEGSSMDADFSLTVTSEVDYATLSEYGFPIIVDYGSDSCIPCVSDFLKWPAFDLTDCPSIAHFSVRQRFNDTGADAPVQSNHFSR